MGRERQMGGKYMSGKTSLSGNIRLTQFAKHGGCAAKIGPDTLSGVLEKLPKFSDPSLLVGFETSDDAAVYKVTDDIAVILWIFLLRWWMIPIPSGRWQRRTP